MATIQGVYVALFGRPADPTGLAYFNSVTQNGANLSAIGNLAGQAEYTARFTGMNNIQIINTIYQSLFGRDADVTGLTFFANELSSGRQTINTIAINILDGATGSDKTTVDNKIAAANLFTAALDTGTEIVAYSGTAAADAGRAFLAAVTTTVPTATAVDTAIANIVNNPTPATIITLTTGVDSFTGTANNDAFNATNSTFSATDTLVGGAGVDTLNYVDTGTTGGALAAAIVSGIEIINVRNVNGTAATTGTKETATVTFADVVVKGNAGGAETVTITIAGRTVTLTGGTGADTTFTAANIASAFAGTASAGITVGGTLSASYTVALGSGSSVVFTSVAVGNATDLTVAAPVIGGGGGAPTTTVATPGIAVVDGTAASASTGVEDTVAAGNFAGATDFNSVNSTSNVAITGLSAGQKVGMVGNGVTTNGNLSAAYGATVTSSTVNISGGTKAGNITLTGAAITSATINSSGAANTVGAVDVAGAKTITIDANTNLTATSVATTATEATLTVKGAATSVSVGTLDDGLVKVDASGLAAGGLTATLNAAVGLTVTGGAGADKITTGSALTTGSVNAGAGSDTLIVADSTHLASAALGAKYTNFETLGVLNGVSVDLDHIAGITAIQITDAGGATSVSNLTATQAAAITVLAADGAATIGVKNASTVGQIDTVKVTFNDGDTTLNEDINASSSTFTLAGVENLELTAIDQIDVTQSATASASLASVKLFGAGDITFVTGDMAASNFVLDGSAATGKLTLNATAFANTTTGASITGGSNEDTITGSAKADVINGGAGKDTITGGDGDDTINGGEGDDTITAGAGVDVVTGGTGADKFIFATTDIDTTAGAVTDTITDFVTKVDTLKFAFGAGSATNYLEATAVAADLATLLSAADTALNGTVKYYVGQVGSDSYIVTDNNGTGYTDVVKLTGVALTAIEFGDLVA